MLFYAPPEQVYPKLRELLALNLKSKQKITIVVPTSAMREKYYVLLNTDVECVAKIGYSIVTLNTFVEMVAPENASIPKQVAFFKIKKWLSSLPDNHCFATISNRVSAPSTIMHAIEEWSEANDIAIPDEVSESDREILLGMIDAKNCIRDYPVNLRAEHYYKASKVLHKYAEEIYQELFSSKVIFVGFYDLSPAQAHFLETFIHYARKYSKKIDVCESIVPYSNSFYGDYPNRMKKWYQSIYANIVIIPENESTRISQRLLSCNGNGGKNQSGEQTCFTVQAIDEAGEVDALLRIAVKLANEKNIPFSDMAFILPSLDPYEAMIHEYQENFRIPIRLMDNISILTSHSGKQVAQFFHWLQDLDDDTQLISFLELMGIDVYDSRIIEQFQKHIIAGKGTIDKRLQNFSTMATLSLKRLLSHLSELLSKQHSVIEFSKVLHSMVQDVWKVTTFPTDELELYARKQWVELVEQANEWLSYLDRDELPNWSTWIASVSEKFYQLQVPVESSESGIWVGRIHQLRGIPFRVILIPKGGVSFSGVSESILIPDRVREKWNRNSYYPLFSTSIEKESEMDWLFAQSIASGEIVVVSFPNQELLTGKELSPSAIYEDYFRSVVTNEKKDLNKVVPKRFEFAKQVALSEEETTYASLANLIPANAICVFPDEYGIPKLQPSHNIGRISQENCLDRFQLKRLSPSMLYDFLLCPLRGYFKYFLPIRIIDRGDELPRNRGSIVHQIIEDLKGSTQNLPDENEWNTFIETYIEKANYPPKERDELEHRLFMKEIFDILRIWKNIRQEMEKDVIKSELETMVNTTVEIPLRDGNKIHIIVSGTIDIVELCKNEIGIERLRMIDWKTGKMESNNQIFSSKEYYLQIPIYTFIKQSNDPKLQIEAKMVYLSPKADGTFSYPTEELNQSILNAIYWLTELINDSSQGYFPPIPTQISNQKKACDFCEFTNVCLDRINQLPQELSSNNDYINHASMNFGDRKSKILSKSSTIVEEVADE